MNPDLALKAAIAGSTDGQLGDLFHLEEVILHHGDPRAEYTAVRDDRAVVLLDGMHLVSVHGRDAADYLNRRLSQRIKGMQPGEVRRAALLDATGKTLADMEVLADPNLPRHFYGEPFKLLSAARPGYRLAEDLERFIFSEDCKVLEPESAVQWAFVGPGRVACAEALSREMLDPFSDCLVLRPTGEDAMAEFDALLPVLGARLAGRIALEARRIELGIPLYPVDFDETNTPLDAGLFNAIDRDKGCFPGQETIAKILNLGHPAKALVRVELEGDGALLRDGWSSGDGDAGRLTSAVEHPLTGQWIGLLQAPWRARGEGIAWSNGGWTARALGPVEHR